MPCSLTVHSTGCVTVTAPVRSTDATHDEGISMLSSASRLLAQVGVTSGSGVLVGVRVGRGVRDARGVAVITCGAGSVGSGGTVTRAWGRSPCVSMMVTGRTGVGVGPWHAPRASTSSIMALASASMIGRAWQSFRVRWCVIRIIL